MQNQIYFGYMGEKIGYARVSTREQNLSSQEDALNKAGCIRIFTDKVSGKEFNREGLPACRRHACHLPLGSSRKIGQGNA